MLQILNVIVPIYILIGIGYCVTRFGLFKKEDMRVLGKFVLNLALPALIIRSLSQNAIGDVFNPTYLLAYLTGTVLMISFGYIWCTLVQRQDFLSATFNIIGMSCSNSGFIGYPVLLLILPEIAGNVLALNMLVENLIIIPFLLFMAEKGRVHHSGFNTIKQTLYRLRYNPIVIGILIGVIFSCIRIPFPPFLTRCIDLFASASSATSLIVIGGSLVGIAMKKESMESVPVIFGKLILHPFFVFCSLSIITAFGLAALEPDYKISIIIMAATPMMGIYPTLAQSYGRESSAALNLLLATTLSFFTLSALLWVMKDYLVFLINSLSFIINSVLVCVLVEVF